MGNFRRFQEFLEAKEQLMDVKDGLAGIDNDGPLATHPPKDEFSKLKPLPYKNIPDEDQKNVVWQANGGGEDKKPLSDENTPGFTPKNSIPDGQAPESKVKHPKFVKMTSEEFINQTKGMSSVEFTKFMLEHSPNISVETITDLYGNEFTPDPMQTVQYLGGLTLGNPKMMERFVREMKRRDGLKNIVEELIHHPETFDILTEMLEESACGHEIAKNFARSMNDRHVSLIDSFSYGESVTETIDAPPDRRFGLDKLTKPTAPKPQGGAFGGGSGPDGSTDPNYQGGTMQKQGGSFGGGGPSAQGQQQPQFAGQPPLQPPAARMKGMMKYMGESAADNMIKAMSGYDHMRERMKHHCTGPNC